jgi:hypothetical protein
MLENVKVNGEIGGRRHILRTLYICPILYKISTSCMKKVQILKKKDPIWVFSSLSVRHHLSVNFLPSSIGDQFSYLFDEGETLETATCASRSVYSVNIFAWTFLN